MRHSTLYYKKKKGLGAWGVQAGKCPTLDLSSGLDLRVMSSSPALGSVVGVKPTLKKKKKR